VEGLANGLRKLSVPISTRGYLEAVRLVVEVDIHDSGRACPTTRRQDGLPVRELATAEVAVFFPPTQTSVPRYQTRVVASSLRGLSCRGKLTLSRHSEVAI
jgi:hypothetical protein